MALSCVVWANAVPSGECDNWQLRHSEWLFCDDFESGTLDEWEDVNGISVAENEDQAHDGQYSAELRYRKGSTGAGWMWRKRLRPDSAATDAQYIRWWQKWQPGFAWASSDDQKLFMLDALEPQHGWGQTASWKIYVHLVGDARKNQGVSENELFLDGFMWDGTSQWSGQWQGLQQNRKIIRYRTGAWECTEIELVHNLPGDKNGSLRVWINEQLAAEHEELKFRDEVVSWNAIQLNAYYGNGGNGVPIDQASWVDQVVVSTERIGCTTMHQSLSPPSGLRVVD